MVKLKICCRLIDNPFGDVYFAYYTSGLHLPCSQKTPTFGWLQNAEHAKTTQQLHRYRFTVLVLDKAVADVPISRYLRTPTILPTALY